MAVRRKNSSPKKVKVKKPKFNHPFLKRDISIIVLAALCIFGAISIWFDAGEKLGKSLKAFVFGMFGRDCGYLIPVIIAVGIIYFIMNKNKEKVRLHLWMIFAFPFWLSSFMHYIYRTGQTQIEADRLYESGAHGTGGVFGGLICEPLWYFTGNAGTFLILLIMFLVIVMLLFEISVLSLAKKLLKKTKEFFASIGEAIRHEDAEEAAGNGNDAPKPKKRGEKEDPLKPYKWFEGDEEIVLSGNIIEDKPAPKPSILEEIFSKKDTPGVEVIEGQPETELVDDGSQIKLDVPPVEAMDIDAAPKKIEYIFPFPDLLDKGGAVAGSKVEMLKANAQKLVEILDSYGIEVKVTNITRGSSVTRYEILPAPGVKVSKITALDQDIALRLPASNVRIEVMPGSIGIEISNENVTSVFLRGLIESEEFNSHMSKIAVALGKDIEGRVVVLDLAKTPHLLIAGATGSGKSVCINTIITSILFKASPEEVRLVMVDPKVVELGMYNGIPHLLVPIVTDPRKAAGALCWAVQEMENRYKLFSENSTRDLAGYNRKCTEKGLATLPQIVIIIDELADLMMVAPSEVQDYICRLAQKARAAGMHLVLATQRPSVDVITGLIKANIPSRISFAVSSQIDSRTIIDQGGAEKLLGRGDMLLMMQGSGKLQRVQGAFVSDKDVERLTGYVKQFGQNDYSEDAIGTIDSSSPEPPGGNGEETQDTLLDAAADVAFELGQISASMLQRRLSIGYARAGRLIDLMDKKKIISSYDGTNKPRQVVMSRGDYLEMRGRE